MQRSTELKELGILFVPDYDLGLNSYFLKRSYGNFLFFTHPKISQLSNYIENSGGIYKVLEYHNVFKNELSFLFNIYGSSLITTNQNFIFDKSYKQELWPSEYFDADMNFLEEISSIEVLYKKKKLLFVDNFMNDYLINEESYDYVFYRRIQNDPAARK